MRLLSLFSGVGGFDLGLERAGMTTVAQVEWNKKCQSVLARHWPDVPRWGDVADVRGADLPDCDVVAFGSPCQDLSVAGKRAGMVEGTRSGLFYEAIRIIKELQDDGRAATWIVWENVVGALSSNRGHDFAAVLDSLGELGAVDIQWRVLDAQHHGVPQRRRRVFVVACFDPRAAGRPEVLPVGASVRRNPAPSDATRQDVAGRSTGSTSGGGEAVDGEWPKPSMRVVGTLSSGAHPGGLNGQDATSGHVIVDVEADTELLGCRRLTPREYERLMGWPDDWTRWGDDGSEMADAQRYRMTANGVVSPVAELIGRCIMEVQCGQQQQG